FKDQRSLAAQAASAQVRLETLSYALHETKKAPPTTAGSAKFSDLLTGRVIYGGASPCYQAGTAFAADTDEVRVDFYYAGMTPGQQLTYRVDYDGVPNQLLGRTQTVDSASGSNFITMSYAYSRIFN